VVAGCELGNSKDIFLDEPTQTGSREGPWFKRDRPVTVGRIAVNRGKKKKMDIKPGGGGELGGTRNCQLQIPISSGH